MNQKQAKFVNQTEYLSRKKIPGVRGWPMVRLAGGRSSRVDGGDMAARVGLKKGSAHFDLRKSEE